jgi:hypothetical protein
MTELENFTRNAARRYLQNIVFVDDEIYNHGTGLPAVVADIPEFASPFREAERSYHSDVDTTNADEALAPSISKIPYHPRQLVQSFAREGMVCALYEPSDGFETDANSELFKLCERADVVILDWDLFNQDGRNIQPLIGNLISQSQNSVPHAARLLVVYTAKPDLKRVADAVFEYMKGKGLEADEVIDPTTLVFGATRLIVLGKPDVSGRPAESKALEVPESQLAERVINEFALMHAGILPSYALYGMASVRRNSKKILDKFHSDMDGPFLLHRALLLENEDAFEQLPELIAEEAMAIMLDDPVPPDIASKLAVQVANGLPLEALTWQPTEPKRPARAAGELARLYVGGGAAAVKSDFKFSKKKVPEVHKAMGCENTKADKRLAALFSLRTRYNTGKGPSLGFGTIIRAPHAGADYEYSLCLMPLCDSIRLKHGDGCQTVFPFWKLKMASAGPTRGIVVQVPGGKYVELFAGGKPRDMLWMERFAPSASGVVSATLQDGTYVFPAGSGGEKLEWVAQLKPAHAQRVAHDIGQMFSRVGVVEAEWLRLVTEGKLES